MKKLVVKVKFFIEGVREKVGVSVSVRGYGICKRLCFVFGVYCFCKYYCF